MLLSYNSTQPLNYLIGINKFNITIKDENGENASNYLYNVPSNAKIKINYPTVSMPSDWEIGRIAVSDNGYMQAIGVDPQVFYDPIYD